MDNLTKIAHNFRELIIQQCRFCGFDKYLATNPDFEFPKITKELLDSDKQHFVAIPGLFGGFTYYLKNKDGEIVLYAEQSSRMDYDASDYSYFAITENASRLLQDEERADAQVKFQELSKKAFEAYRQKTAGHRV